MHTVMVVVGGLLLLGLFLLAGRMIGAANPRRTARLALCFIPVWLACSVLNLWIGVSQVGYSVADETPVLLVVFGIPAAVAAFVWWRNTRR